jgi:CBS-domain-containing membrane protein
MREKSNDDSARPPLLARLHPYISRFLGHRPRLPPAPLPFPPFSLLARLPRKLEAWLLSFVGAFTAILLIEFAMATPGSVFADRYHAPLIVASFGAGAVLVFGAPEAPLSQPRNVLGGQLVAALVGTAVTRLFALDERYRGWVEEGGYHPVVIVNGALSMALTLLITQVLNVLHPP